MNSVQYSSRSTYLLPSSGHQHPWYGLCRIGKFLSYLRKNFNYLCHVNFDKWYKIKHMLFLLKNLAHKTVKPTLFHFSYGECSHQRLIMPIADLLGANYANPLLRADRWRYRQHIKIWGNNSLCHFVGVGVYVLIVCKIKERGSYDVDHDCLIIPLRHWSLGKNR